jgi:enterochelin esterase-like enzyme
VIRSVIALAATSALLASCSSDQANAPTPTASAPEASEASVAVKCPGAGTVESTTAPFGPRGHQQAEVYLPACYDADPSRRYPVIYLLHGASADQTQWRDVGITAAADQLIAAGQLAPFVIVMPDGGPAMPDSLSKDLVDSLIPWAERTYRVGGDAAQRAVGGISRGGRVALEAAAAHPSLFAAVGGHSPAVDHGEDAMAVHLGKVPGAIRLDAGQSDSLSGGMQRFAEEARSAGADVEVVIAPGAHDRAYWRSQVAAYLHFYADRWAGSRRRSTSAGTRPPG